jgi:hypothetical protein
MVPAIFRLRGRRPLVHCAITDVVSSHDCWMGRSVNCFLVVTVALYALELNYCS